VEFWNIVEIQIIREPKFGLDGFSVLQRRLVRIIRDDPNNGITKGQIGTILEVRGNFELIVELDKRGGTILFALFECKRNDIIAFDSEYIQKKL
jgi:hypothetical protein